MYFAFSTAPLHIPNNALLGTSYSRSLWVLDYYVCTGLDGLLNGSTRDRSGTRASLLSDCQHSLLKVKEPIRSSMS